jgi:hypothetical protein
MDNVIVKYSDFFQDDGGFEKIKKDFTDLGDFLIKEAKRVKSDANLVDLQDIKAITNYEKKTEELTETFEKYAKAKEDVAKIEKEYLATQKKITRAELDSNKALDELNIELKQYQLAVKSVNELEKQGKISVEEATVARGKAKLSIKAINQEIAAQEKELIALTKLTKEEIKLMEAKAILEKEEVKNLEDIRKRLSALRLVASQVNITTEEGTAQVKKYNDEINQLTDTLAENSDKFIQNKINVGNYEESITKALQSTALFKTNIQALDGALSSFVKALTLSKEELADLEKNLAGGGNALQRFALAFGKLNKTLKFSIIALVITALSSLAAVFNQGRSGAISTARALQKFSAVAKIAIGVLADVGRGLIRFFGALFTSFRNGFRNIRLFFLELQESFASLKDSLPDLSFGKKTKEDIDNEKKRQEGLKKLRDEIAKLKAEQEAASKETNYADAWDSISNAIKNARDQWAKARDTFDSVDDLVFKTFEYADAIKKLEIQITKSQGRISELELASEDSTTSFADQQKALNSLLVEKLALLEKESEVARKNLILANLKAEIDANANNIDINANPESDPQNFTRQLLQKNITIDERTQVNPLDDALLEEAVAALNAYQEKLNEISLFEKEVGRTRRQLALDLFEQNLDLLIDLIDTEKNLSEQQVNNVNLAFKDRVIEFERFLKFFRENAQKELDEFNKLALNLGLKGIDFKVNYDDEGTFEILIGDQKLALDNVVELNKQLQATGLPEITINRFREFIVESRNAVKDFKELNKELTLAGIKVKELFANIKVDDAQNAELDDLNRRIRDLKLQTPDFLDNAERKKILKQLEKLEREKTEIIERADYLRNQNRIQAINDELELVREGSERELELLRERKVIEKEIIDQAIEKNTASTVKQNEKAIAEYEKFISELKQVFQSILDKITEVSNQRVQKSEEEVSKQSALIDEQKRRAEQGLTNTLAFEQKALAEREAEVLKQRKRQERLEKIKALYTAYNSYAEKEPNPNQAIAKALRDFAILESISATFGDGGLVADKVPTDGRGITRGRSHRGQHGGIPVLVEGGEGFFSAAEVKNIGRDTFYKLKQQASLGALDTNFFTVQKNTLLGATPAIVNNDSRLISELREVRLAIEAKPNQSVDLPKVVDGILKFTETFEGKNKTVRNHYAVKKPRL